MGLYITITSTEVGSRLVPLGHYNVYMALEVQCVDVGSNPKDCRDIDFIGLPAQEGGIVSLQPERVYELIEDEGRDVVVEHQGYQTDVEGVKRGSTKYVRSEPNDTKDDNLLKQSSC